MNFSSVMKLGIKRVFDKSYNILEYEVNSSWMKYVSGSYNEYRRNWEKASKGHFFKFPLCIEIESSYYCNLRCPVCARQVLGTFNERGIFDRKLYTKLIAEAAKFRMPALMLDHEAEPLTNPQIADMTKEASQAGILDIWMHTNANLLTEEISKELIKNGLTKINFSIDAATKETYDKVRPGGDFNKVTKNITNFLRLKEKLKKRHIRTRVSFVVQEANKSEKDAFFKFWKDKVNVISFQKLVDFSKFNNRVKSLHKCNQDFVCYKTWQLLIIRHNGDVLPCGMPYKHYDSKDYLLGNLHKNTIEECWNSPTLNIIRKFQAKGQYFKLPFCKDCSLAYINVD